MHIYINPKRLKATYSATKLSKPVYTLAPNSSLNPFQSSQSKPLKTLTESTAAAEPESPERDHFGVPFGGTKRCFSCKPVALAYPSRSPTTWLGALFIEDRAVGSNLGQIPQPLCGGAHSTRQELCGVELRLSLVG